MEQKSEKFIFNLQNNTTVFSVIRDILKNNGVPEERQEYIEKVDNNEKTKFDTVFNSAIALSKKESSEENIRTTLEKDLGVSVEATQRIINDIKQKLIPYGKIIQLTNSPMEDLSAQDIILEKIRSREDSQKDYLFGIKKIAVTNVEENAKLSQKDKIYTDEIKKSIQEGLTKETIKRVEENHPSKTSKEDTVNKNSFSEEKKEADVYREPIE